MTIPQFRGQANSVSLMVVRVVSGVLQELVDDPGTVNKAAESGGWFTKFRVRNHEQIWLLRAEKCLRPSGAVGLRPFVFSHVVLCVWPGQGQEGVRRAARRRGLQEAHRGPLDGDPQAGGHRAERQGGRGSEAQGE